MDSESRSVAVGDVEPPLRGMGVCPTPTPLRLNPSPVKMISPLWPQFDPPNGPPHTDGLSRRGLLGGLATGTGAPFQVISGYRSPRTNASLRAAGGGQAGHSLHMRGQAVDVRLADVSSASIRDAARELGLGGVGYYRGEDFVHLDTGRIRHW